MLLRQLKTRLFKQAYELDKLYIFVNIYYIYIVYVNIFKICLLKTGSANSHFVIRDFFQLPCFFSELFGLCLFSFCGKENKSLATGTGSWASNELGESNIASEL